MNSSKAAAGSHITLSIYSLWRRELIRFFRQRNRIVGALGTPIIFWIFLGAGLGDSFRAPESYGARSPLQFMAPGVVAMIALFTAIFSTISIIEDRKEGFLQGVLVSPCPRFAMVMGKILGGATLAFIQAGFFMALTPLIGIQVGSLMDWIMVAVSIFGLSLGMTALGFILAWRMESTQGFHAIMNLFLMPMWLLSGSIFPVESAAGWLRWIMNINPLTYGVQALRMILDHQRTGVAYLYETSFWMAAGVFTSFTVILVCVGLVIAGDSVQFNIGAPAEPSEPSDSKK
jgi:ABC-2 type transport system permease protein